MIGRLRLPGGEERRHARARTSCRTRRVANVSDAVVAGPTVDLAHARAHAACVHRRRQRLLVAASSTASVCARSRFFDGDKQIAKAAGSAAPAVRVDLEDAAAPSAGTHTLTAVARDAAGR